MPTFQLNVQEIVMGYYEIEAKSKKEAEAIYYGNAIGEVGEIETTFSEYNIESIEKL